MKKLIIIILFVFSYNLWAQKTLEKAVLVELNSYRKIHKLPPAFMDAAINNAAKYHTTWMSKSGVCSHYEEKDVPGFTELYGPEERGEHFGILSDIVSFGEICNFTRATDASNPIVERPLSEAQLAKSIIKKFSESPSHNEEMLQKINSDSVLKAGVSVIIKDGIAYTTIYFVEK